MSDFEIFSGFETQDAMDPASFERFKEQMKANGRQVKALQAGEQKQKKQEDRLIRILLKFIHTSQKKDLVLLVSRALEKNIPAIFILGIIILGNEDVQEESGLKVALLKESDGEMQTLPNVQKKSVESERKIIQFSDIEHSLPLKIRIEIDFWGKNLLETAKSISHKVLNRVKNEKSEIEPILIRLTGHVLLEFLQDNKFETEITVINEFAEFLIKGIVRELENEIKGQKQLLTERFS